MVKRVVKTSKGYPKNGKFYKKWRANGPGARRQVWNGTAYQTDSGLTRSDLIKNKYGRLVSKKKHNTAKRENRLKKHGWTAKKGAFGAVRIGEEKKGRSRKGRSRKGRSRKGKTRKGRSRKGRSRKGKTRRR